MTPAPVPAGQPAPRPGLGYRLLHPGDAIAIAPAPGRWVRVVALAAGLAAAAFLLARIA